MGREELGLSASQQLTYFRQQVDRLQEDQFRTGARPSINKELDIAREELKTYVRKLREAGYNI